MRSIVPAIARGTVGPSMSQEPACGVEFPSMLVQDVSGVSGLFPELTLS